jgi:hypothetical protein
MSRVGLSWRSRHSSAADFCSLSSPRTTLALNWGPNARRARRDMVVRPPGAVLHIVLASPTGRTTKIYTDMPLAELKGIIQKTDTRKSATELTRPKPKKMGKVLSFVKKVKERIKRLREREADATKQQEIQKERSYAGYER